MNAQDFIDDSADFEYRESALSAWQNGSVFRIFLQWVRKKLNGSVNKTWTDTVSCTKVTVGYTTDTASYTTDTASYTTDTACWSFLCSVNKWGCQCDNFFFYVYSIFANSVSSVKLDEFRTRRSYSLKILAQVTTLPSFGQDCAIRWRRGECYHRRWWAPKQALHLYHMESADAMLGVAAWSTGSGRRCS